MTATQSATVLIAEDDPEIRTALERILTYEGYRTVSANDGAAALEAMVEHRPDAVVLDVMMPHVDGLTVCRKLRDRGDRTPILMLTARHELQDRVAGLDAGADDYLPKPFELDELLARIRALLRRGSDQTDGPVVVGPLRLDPARYEVQLSGEAIDLTRTEFEILHLLMRNEGIVLERSVIYERIWGYDFESSSRSLDVHVGYLRRKLEAGDRSRILENGPWRRLRPAGTQGWLNHETWPGRSARSGVHPARGLDGFRYQWGQRGFDQPADFV